MTWFSAIPRCDKNRDKLKPIGHSAKDSRLGLLTRFRILWLQDFRNILLVPKTEQTCFHCV